LQDLFARRLLQTVGELLSRDLGAIDDSYWLLAAARGPQQYGHCQQARWHNTQMYAQNTGSFRYRGKHAGRHDAALYQKSVEN
jgi:hypothetical protein